MTQPFFDIRASWNHEERERCSEVAAQWFDANCPKLFRASDPTRLNPTLLEVCNGWRLGPGGLGLFGPTGTTKTRCMWKLIRRIAAPRPRLDVQKWGGLAYRRFEYRYHVQFYCLDLCVVRDVDFARECADQFKDHHDGKRLKSWRKCAVLFIDDLGKSRITDGSRRSCSTWSTRAHRTGCRFSSLAILTARA